MGSSKDHGELQSMDGDTGSRAVRRARVEGGLVVSGAGVNSRPVVANSRLVSLRHHASLWLAPAAMLVGALFSWPYGYYTLLRLAVCGVSSWIAYEQWRHDGAISGWVVAFGAAALLYNPAVPIHLTREIWSVLNVVTAALFLGHLWALTRLVANESERHERRFARYWRRTPRRHRKLPRPSDRKRLRHR